VDVQQWPLEDGKTIQQLINEDIEKHKLNKSNSQREIKEKKGVNKETKSKLKFKTEDITNEKSEQIPVQEKSTISQNDQP